VNEPIRVLVVDDHRLFSQALGLLLRSEPDIQVLGAVETGEDALRFCRHTEVDVALVDIDLPGMDGVAVTTRLGEIRPDVRVVVITAFQHPDVVARAVRAGARGYVVKTDVADTLVGAIRLAMAGNIVLPAGKFGLDASEPADREHLGGQRRPPRSGRQPAGLLSDRELEILDAIAEGTSTADMADRLSIREATVRSHVKSILSKLEVHSKAEAVMKGIRLGLIAAEPD